MTQVRDQAVADATKAIDYLDEHYQIALDAMATDNVTIAALDEQVASLQQQLADCQAGTPPPPPDPDPTVRYEYTDFLLAQSEGALSIQGGAGGGAQKINTRLFSDRMELRCDGVDGAEVMFPRRDQYGYWEVECYFDASATAQSLPRPSTKICLLLWTEGSWSQNHHEIDFNESALRNESHQTIHDENTAGVHVMKQTKYNVNQYEKHVYGVRIGQAGVNFVEYYLDGVLQNSRVLAGGGVNVPTDNWNLHIRTIPKGSTDKTTLVVTRVKATE